MILPNKLFFDHQDLIKQKIEQNEWIKKNCHKTVFENKKKQFQQRLNLEKSRQHLEMVELLNSHYEVLIFYVIHILCNQWKKS